jgi:hypothetical protein
MSSLHDDQAVGGQLFVGAGTPIILGIGPTKVRGSSYVEGPQIVGDCTQFTTPDPTELASLMAAETKNSDMKPIPFYSLFVKTYARIKSFLKIDTLLSVELIKSKIIWTEVLLAKSKNFAIDHPIKENKLLIYSCLEGPENAVYIRGRLQNETEIKLPDYWKKLIDPQSITVSLTPIGKHQDIIVEDFDIEKVVLGTNYTAPIDCFYHIFAERIDIKKLQTEVNK